MKKCKILRINDGNAEVLQNGNRLFVEEFLNTENVLEHYLNKGWEVKQIVSDFDPAPNEEGKLIFYKGGLVIYMEKDE